MALGLTTLTSEVFAPLTYRSRLSNSGLPLLAFRSSTECYLHTGAAFCRAKLRIQLLPCGLFPFGVFPVPGSNQSGGNQPPGLVTLTAFRTLSGPCSTRYLPALFHAGTALGVSTLQGSSRPRSRTPSRTPLPSCGSPTSRYLCHPVAAPGPSRARPRKPHSILAAQTHWRQAPLQGLAPRERLYSRPVVWTEPRAATLMGLLLPRGFSLFTGAQPGAILS
jgi:hypothetical protein